MPNELKQVKVFLCHSNQDKAIVREIHKKLCAEGWIDPWLDEKKILPGQDWNMEIEKAVETSHIVLVFLTNNSVNKEGYVQRELRKVLDVASGMPEDTIFVIPVKLEECQMPRRLTMWQWLNYFPSEDRDEAYERLLASLKIRANTIGISTSPLPVENKSPALSPPGSVSLPLEKTVITSGVSNAPSTKALETSTYGGIEFVKVLQGSFMMGSHGGSKWALDREGPRHRLTIPYDFFMARYPVTNEQFSEFVKATKFKPVDERKGWENLPKHPVGNVTGYEAIAFCEWLNETYGKSIPDGWSFRLPTEDEWERAARGNTENEYPWGDEFISANCNSRESGIGTTTPVGAYSPQGDSPWGVCDMAGNVWEMTASQWGGENKDVPEFRYPYNSRDGREDLRLVDQTTYVRRGGSFVDEPQFTRSAFRQQHFIQDWYTNVGFRVVLAPQRR